MEDKTKKFRLFSKNPFLLNLAFDKQIQSCRLYAVELTQASLQLSSQLRRFE